MTKRYDSIWPHFRFQSFYGNNILHFLIMLRLYDFHIQRNVSYNLFEIITVLQPSCQGNGLKSGENIWNCRGIRILLNRVNRRVLHPLGAEGGLAPDGAGCIKGLCSLRSRGDSGFAAEGCGSGWRSSFQPPSTGRGWRRQATEDRGVVEKRFRGFKRFRRFRGEGIALRAMSIKTALRDSPSRLPPSS